MKKLASRLCLLLLCANVLAAAPAPGLDSLAPRPREMLLASLRFIDGYWDEAAGLIRSPAEGENGVHRVRESTWYAMGLLMRRQPGDVERATRILETVVAQQYAAPGKAWDGTFRRTPEEPAPQHGGRMWNDYDPNWREFIGTTFALILLNDESLLPAPLCARLQASLVRAVEGELAEHRLVPGYTNIAIMHGFLWSFAGRRLGREEWVAQGEAWAEKVHELYAAHGTFEEYNSPTYYGVDLYGLALCRRYGVTEKIRALGAEMEAGLWREIGGYYHAGLKNLSGPFDRSYGMDLRRYVALTGVWMSLVLDPAETPLPDPSGPMDHAHDFAYTPAFVLLGAQVPADVLPVLHRFPGEHQLERIISPDRVATAWLAPDMMLGGESTRQTRAAGPGTRHTQFNPATGYWRVGESGVGWFVLSQCPEVDAKAAPGLLTITTARGESVFRLSAPGLDPARLTQAHWSLPGLEVAVETDAAGFTVTPGQDSVEVVYRGATRFILHPVPAKK